MMCVLVLMSQRKSRKTPSWWEMKTRPLGGVNALCFVQCFDAVGNRNSIQTTKPLRQQVEVEIVGV